MTQNLQNLRAEVKLKLRARKYKDALNIVLQNAQDSQLKNKISENIDYLSKLQSELTDKKIDTNAFYYGINKIVSDTLDAVDEIIGEPDEDWDFIDELTSSLKFNLVDQSEKEQFNQQNVVMTKVEDGQVSFEYQPNLDDSSENNQSRIRIRKLYEQLNYYEEKLQTTDDMKEKAKLHSIIKAININISEENRNLKN